MPLRTTTATVTFRHPARIGNFDELIPPGTYKIETDEELVDGLSFEAYRRVVTVIFLPTLTGNTATMRVLPIDPKDIAETLERDAADEATAFQKFLWAGWEFDCGSQTLTSPAGENVDLTGGEVRLLTAFLSRPNRILSRDQIIEMISSGDAPAFDRSIDVRVARLRKKLQGDDPKASFIRTVRNYGYQFAAKVDRA